MPPNQNILFMKGAKKILNKSRKAKAKNKSKQRKSKHWPNNNPKVNKNKKVYFEISLP